MLSFRGTYLCMNMLLQAIDTIRNIMSLLTHHNLNWTALDILVPHETQVLCNSMFSVSRIWEKATRRET